MTTMALYVVLAAVLLTVLAIGVGKALHQLLADPLEPETPDCAEDDCSAEAEAFADWAELEAAVARHPSGRRRPPRIPRQLRRQQER